jgi:hypothetical protein
MIFSPPEPTNNPIQSDWALDQVQEQELQLLDAW